MTVKFPSAVANPESEAGVAMATGRVTAPAELPVAEMMLTATVAFVG